MKTIFVQIASYRDSECKHTIDDLFQKAKYPEKITIGLNWQYADEDNDIPFFDKPYKSQIRCVRFPYYKSEGACWARSKTQSLYDGERYTLQIDAHMRFTPDWDDTLIRMYQRLRDSGCQKPIISHYPPGYTLDGRFEKKVKKMSSFLNEKDGIFTMSRTDHQLPEHGRPFLSSNCAAGFFFSDARIIQDVPYDPHLYFYGEEITLTARVWTSGYDIFNPAQPILFHLYKRSKDENGKLYKTRDFKLHQADNDARERNLNAKRRVRHLLGTEYSDHSDVLESLESYQLGQERSLYQFEKFSGLGFKTLSKNTYSRLSHHVMDKVPATRTEEETLLEKLASRPGKAHFVYLDNVSEYFKRISCTSIMHLGCGVLEDDLPITESISYLGIDHYPDIAQINSDRLSNKNCRFIAQNYLSERLEACDAVLCDNLFENMPVSQVWQLLESIGDSAARFLITSYYPESAKNLCRAPFFFPEPHSLIPIKSVELYYALWRIPDIRAYMQALDIDDSLYRARLLRKLEEYMRFLKRAFLGREEMLRTIVRAIVLPGRGQTYERMAKDSGLTEYFKHHRDVKHLIDQIINMRYRAYYDQVKEYFPSIEPNKSFLDMLVTCEFFEQHFSYSSSYEK